MAIAEPAMAITADGHRSAGRSRVADDGHHAACLDGHHQGRSGNTPSTNEVAIDAVADPRDQALSHAVLHAVLDRDYERARRLAEEWRQRRG